MVKWTETVPGSYPQVFRQSRLLIVGCGDVGQRVLGLLGRRLRVRVLIRGVDRRATCRETGVTPILGDLDDPCSLRRLTALAPRVLHLAPPPSVGQRDPRTAALVQALRWGGGRVRQLVYGSTTGVYGDAQGAWVDETCPIAPRNDRAWRRVDAEQRLRAWGRVSGVRVTILRIPGIYAMDRLGGDPRERVKRGAFVLAAEDDVFTNHIHADDLARACWLALWRGHAQRVVQVCDDTQMRMGDYFDRVADLAGLPRPPRVRRSQAHAVMSPMQLSFLRESRRMTHTRMTRELRLVLRYPDIAATFAATSDG